MRNLKNSNNGVLDPLAIPLIISILVIIGLAGFGIWSFIQLSDAQEVEKSEIDAAVSEASAALTDELENDFAEREKQPFRKYRSPSYTGSIEVTYPKTWSLYSEEEENSSTPLNATFHPEYVRAEKSENNDALRVTLTAEEYSEAVEDFESFIEDGESKARAITISGVTGIRVDGRITKDISDASMVLLPLRDKTLKIFTENRIYKTDFDNVILKNISFIP